LDDDETNALRDAIFCFGTQVNIINEFNTREEVAKEEGKSIADVPDSRVGAAVIFCK
jgi:hypothetical protein